MNRQAILTGIVLLLLAGTAIAKKHDGIWGFNYDAAKQIKESTLVVVLDDDPTNEYSQTVKTVFRKRWELCPFIFAKSRDLNSIVPNEHYTIFRPVLTNQGRTGLCIFRGDGNFRSIKLKESLAGIMIGKDVEAGHTFIFYDHAILLMQDALQHALRDKKTKRLDVKEFNSRMRLKGIRFWKKRFLIPEGLIHYPRSFKKDLKKMFPFDFEIVPISRIEEAIRYREFETVYVFLYPDKMFGFIDVRTGECFHLHYHKDDRILEPRYFKDFLKKQRYY